LQFAKARGGNDIWFRIGIVWNGICLVTVTIIVWRFIIILIVLIVLFIILVVLITLITLIILIILIIVLLVFLIVMFITLTILITVLILRAFIAVILSQAAIPIAKSLGYLLRSGLDRLLIRDHHNMSK
jgi:hypothetical protein